MPDIEEFLMLRDLFNEGLSISEIARRTGYCGMVRKYLPVEFHLHGLKAGIPRSSKLKFLLYDV
jgi:hypothetical protein